MPQLDTVISSLWFCLHLDGVDQIQGPVLRGIGGCEDGERSGVAARALGEAAVAGERCKLGEQGRKAVDGRAVVELAPVDFGEGASRTFGGRDGIAFGLRRLIRSAERRVGKGCVSTGG